MTTFNITNLTSTNITSMGALFRSVDAITYNTLFPAFTIGLWILLFTSINARTRNGKKAILASSFVIFVINSILVLGGLMSVWMAILALIVFSFSLFSFGY